MCVIYIRVYIYIYIYIHIWKRNGNADGQNAMMNTAALKDLSEVVFMCVCVIYIRVCIYIYMYV